MKKPSDVRDATERPMTASVSAESDRFAIVACGVRAISEAEVQRLGSDG